jgi:hypothetical protein
MRHECGASVACERAKKKGDGETIAQFGQGEKGKGA